MKHVSEHQTLIETKEAGASVQNPHEQDATFPPPDTRRRGPRGASERARRRCPSACKVNIAGLLPRPVIAAITNQWLFMSA